MKSRIIRKSEKATGEEIELLKQKGLLKPVEEELGFLKCPRCGKTIDYVRKDIRKNGDIEHIYYYAIHYNGTMSNGRPILEQHYLGALRYYYVEKFHNLGLRGYVSEHREILYLKELLDKLLDNKNEERLTSTDLIEIISKINMKFDKIIFNGDDKEKLRTQLEYLIEKLK